MKNLKLRLTEAAFYRFGWLRFLSYVNVDEKKFLFYQIAS